MNLFYADKNVTLYQEDTLRLLRWMGRNPQFQLIVTSPPYNLDKEYEEVKSLDEYAEEQQQIIEECYKRLNHHGHICWQVGNYVKDGCIVPLDTVLYPYFAKLGLKLRNRIVWHFNHGLHCKNRFSGRYETVLWFTKSDDYYFNLDPVRVPQKYPNKKHYKGPNKGKLSCNPKGANPSDVWDIPNVKHNHCEKTVHPCQFPIELIDRLVLSMTQPGDVVFDPYIGSGSTAISAVRNNRMCFGVEKSDVYLNVAVERLRKLYEGQLKIRPGTFEYNVKEESHDSPQRPICPTSGS